VAGARTPPSVDSRSTLPSALHSTPQETASPAVNAHPVASGRVCVANTFTAGSEGGRAGGGDDSDGLGAITVDGRHER
jgi:hypothetical protein